ncbi:hypothetical protein LINPERPRIM_LOCUS37798 [Linum perenne]
MALHQRLLPTMHGHTRGFW